MKITSLLLLLLMCTSLMAQPSESTIAQKIDGLRYTWDDEAKSLKRYEGLEKFCRESMYRKTIITMLDDIHHYDTLLYGIVKRKYQANQGAEAKATLADIETLETSYTTRSFRRFIHSECSGLNEIENNFGRAGGKKYRSEVKRLESELKKYVLAITKRIDVIDKHMHHLHIGE